MDSESFVHPALRRKKRKDGPGAGSDPSGSKEDSAANPPAKRAKPNDSNTNQSKKPFQQPKKQGGAGSGPRQDGSVQGGAAAGKLKSSGEKRYKDLPKTITGDTVEMLARKERRKRTKTRSKQKNIKKDTRPLEKKPGGADYLGEILPRTKEEEEEKGEGEAAQMKNQQKVNEKESNLSSSSSSSSSDSE